MGEGEQIGPAVVKRHPSEYVEKHDMRWSDCAPAYRLVTDRARTKSCVTNTGATQYLGEYEWV